MKEKLTNNLSLKILSLLVAILVWLLAINIDNPIVKKTFIVTDVQLLNEAYIDADGKMCMRNEEQEPVGIAFQGEPGGDPEPSCRHARGLAGDVQGGGGSVRGYGDAGSLWPGDPAACPAPDADGGAGLRCL